MSKPQKEQSNSGATISSKTYPLSQFIAIAFLIAMLIGVAAFVAYWLSDNRQLAVGIQEASEEEVINPFVNPQEAQDLDFDNGILEKDELKLLIKQINDLKEDLNPATDFSLKDETSIEAILEF